MSVVLYGQLKRYDNYSVTNISSGAMYSSMDAR